MKHKPLTFSLSVSTTGLFAENSVIVLISLACKKRKLLCDVAKGHSISIIPLQCLLALVPPSHPPMLNLPFALCGYTTVLWVDCLLPRYIVTSGNDGDVRIWEGLDDDDPRFITVGEKVYSMALKVASHRDNSQRRRDHRRAAENLCVCLRRTSDWWRPAPTTRCRYTRFLTASRTASWPASARTQHTSPSTTAGPKWLLVPGTVENFLLLLFGRVGQAVLGKLL